MLIPDDCTSINAKCVPPVKYCRDCSHALFNGKIKVGKTTYLFEFSPQFGPRFVTKTGEERKKTPGEDHPFWVEFKKWHNEKFKENI